LIAFLSLVSVAASAQSNQTHRWSSILIKSINRHSSHTQPVSHSINHNNSNSLRLTQSFTVQYIQFNAPSRVFLRSPCLPPFVALVRQGVRRSLENQSPAVQERSFHRYRIDNNPRQICKPVSLQILSRILSSNLPASILLTISCFYSLRHSSSSLNCTSYRPSHHTFIGLQLIMGSFVFRWYVVQFLPARSAPTMRASRVFTVAIVELCPPRSLSISCTLPTA
jgi:hypothetical protein